MGITWCSNVYQKWTKPLHHHHDIYHSFKEGFYFPNEDDARKFNATSLNKNIKRNLIDRKVKDINNHSPPSLKYTNSQSNKLCSTTVRGEKTLIHPTNITNSELVAIDKVGNINNLSDNLTKKNMVLDKTPMDVIAPQKRLEHDCLDVKAQKIYSSNNGNKNKYLPIKSKSHANYEQGTNISGSKKIKTENIKENKMTTLFGKKGIPSNVQSHSSVKTEGETIHKNVSGSNDFVKSQSAQRNKGSVRKIKEKFVDDFGNPLLRGAGSEQVISFRECRGLCKETRDLLDQAKRSKTKTEVALLTRQDSSRPQQKKLSDFSDQNKIMTKNDDASTLKKEEYNIERFNQTGNEGTSVKHHPFLKFSQRIFRRRKTVNDDDIIPPFLQQ